MTAIALQKFGSYLKILSKKYQWGQMTYSFDAFVLVILITSEISILSYSNIYNS